MSENRLYSVAAIAKLLQLPESTLHYWKNRFDDILPSVGKGRGKRFRPEAVEIFKSVGRMLGQGLSAADVKAALSRQYPVNVSPEPTELPADPAPADPAGVAAIGAQIGAQIGTHLAMVLADHLKAQLVPAQPALPGEPADGLKDELETLRAQNAELTTKLMTLEAELVRLRKDRRELEAYLLQKIESLKSGS